MNEINSLTQLKYIFNSKKLNSEQAKEGMKAFLKNKEIDIIASMKASIKAELSISSDALELTSGQKQLIVDLIIESK